MMTNEEADKLINDFCKHVDDELKLQKDINVFSREVVTPNIIKIINSDEAFPTVFNDRKFAFKIKCFKRSGLNDILKISVMDLEKYQKYLKLSAGEFYRAKTATFEYEPEYEMTEQIANVVTLLMFDVFGLEMSANEVS